MISGIDNDFKFLHDALNLRSYRQQVLASNIANADTPNYKARDIDFAKELQRAQGGQAGNLNLSATSPGHMQAPAGVLNAQALYRASVQPSIDGNTVDMDVERAQFADNAIHYQFIVDQISSKGKTLLSAIRGE